MITSKIKSFPLEIMDWNYWNNQYQFQEPYENN